MTDIFAENRYKVYRDCDSDQGEKLWSKTHGY